MFESMTRSLQQIGRQSQTGLLQGLDEQIEMLCRVRKIQDA
ncbi:hypothetical protein KSB_89590 [Ktedonobacter robiniae]|uniref:Uncharacterized protein n=1 Tax=Ktedonobacter robiniae TaxID=2778365 RepID=A0ABQ3V694_9CHLR|nr:hypothetical protein KSB_89590 [Ktedonobacter robiniae]